MEGTLEKVRELDGRLEIMVTHGCTAHFHSQVELLAVRRGAVNVTVNGVSRRLTAGNAVIADSYAVHAWAPEPRGEGVVLIVPVKYLAEYSAIMKGRTFAESVISDGTEGGRILKLLELLKSERPDSLAARGMVTAILGEFVERLPKRARNTDNQTDLMRDALLYLTDNFTEPLSLGILAKKYGYTLPLFAHLQRVYRQKPHVVSGHAARRARRRAAVRRPQRHRGGRGGGVSEHAVVLPHLFRRARRHAARLPAARRRLTERNFFFLAAERNLFFL